MSVKNGDFVKLSYTGRLENGDVFDTTSEDVAKENGLFAEGISYAPITIIAGEDMVVKGLDTDLVGKAAGYEGQVKVLPKNAFGERRPELIEVVPTRRFEKRPTPGMRVSLDGKTGTVENVVGGRVRVDFNSPYAGKIVIYHYKIEEIVTNNAERIKGLLKYFLNQDLIVHISKKTVTITIPYELGLNQQVLYYKKFLAEKIMLFTNAEEVDYLEVHKRAEPKGEKAAEAVADKKPRETAKRETAKKETAKKETAKKETAKKETA
ncbi:MAG TPA: FKBP-type peptidyl-prolyl cis-trans isomerase, partial [Candidatus Acidoferrales bacterium]|nr:FKBP-type peptidyl-prolyl cis-trans isomerase [Candidatus Acidoferrales bacterium]